MARWRTHIRTAPISHRSFGYYRRIYLQFIFVILIAVVSSRTRAAAAFFFTPCNYPVPNNNETRQQFEQQCGNNYLQATYPYVCDIDRQISNAETHKINELLSKYPIYSVQQHAHVRIGLAVLRTLEYPDWTGANLPAEDEQSTEDGREDMTTDDDDGDRSPVDTSDQHRDTANSEEYSSAKRRLRRRRILRTPRRRFAAARRRSTTDFDCFTKSQSDFYRSLEPDTHVSNTTVIDHYLNTFADALRRRWFADDGGDCCTADLFFLLVTDYVLDHTTARKLHYSTPTIRVSVSRLLDGVLPSGYRQQLQDQLSSYSSPNRNILAAILVGLERVAELVSPDVLAAERLRQRALDGTAAAVVSSSPSKSSSKDRITQIRVKHTIPSWAIYTFVGCIGSVGLALGLEWTIVRRKALTLRAGGGGERAPRQKSDNVQVHLYF